MEGAAVHYPKPVYRRDRGTWIVDFRNNQGKKERRTLASEAKGETEADAWKAYHRLMASLGRAAVKDDLTIELALDMFVVHARQSISADAADQYAAKCQDFTNYCGSSRVADLRAVHVQQWIDTHRWSDSTKRGAITALKVALNWCAREGHISANPIKDMKRPKMGRRERIVSAGERAIIRNAAGAVFADYLDAMTWSGTRPGEIMRLEARHIDFETGFAALPGKTTAATGEMIEFPLTPPMRALCQRLAEKYRKGPLFRNSDGDPWTPNAVRCRMRRLRLRLKKKGIDISGVTAYAFRHTYATDALERGVSLADLAALMNHKDIRTTMNYNHLKTRRDHLSRQALKATGEAADPGSTASEP
jgi:integrase